MRNRRAGGAVLMIEESTLTILFGWVFLEAARHGDKLLAVLGAPRPEHADQGLETAIGIAARGRGARAWHRARLRHGRAGNVGGVGRLEFSVTEDG